ncbi:MAG: sulfurtransferase TusA family protein [Promethearchaeia archaeon]
MSKTHELDCTGLVCPMPVAQTKKRLKKLDPGEILEVSGDFCEAGENIKRFVEKHGDKVLELDNKGNNYYLKIEKQ